MKNKLLAASLLSVLALPAFADYAVDGKANTGTGDDADDLQSVSVTVPEVALLDIKDGTGTDGSNTNTIIITAPTTAGEGFTGSATLGVTYALSSNVAAVAAGGNSTARRTISAKLDKALPENWLLSANMVVAGGGSTSAGKTSLNSTTDETLLTNIGNERTTSDQSITYTLEPSSANAMMAYETNRSITITYTLSGDV